MAESIERIRKAARIQPSTMLGTTPGNPNYNAGHQQSNPMRGEIAKLPSKKCSPAQDLDPASPTFGQFLFMVGFDALGGGAPLG